VRRRNDASPATARAAEIKPDRTRSASTKQQHGYGHLTSLARASCDRRAGPRSAQSESRLEIGALTRPAPSRSCSSRASYGSLSLGGTHVQNVNRPASGAEPITPWSAGHPRCAGRVGDPPAATRPTRGGGRRAGTLGPPGQARGDIAASAAFLESAATLTPEPAEHVRRLIAAAHASAAPERPKRQRSG
jgi:hypothetical protein